VHRESAQKSASSLARSLQAGGAGTEGSQGCNFIHDPAGGEW